LIGVPRREGAPYRAIHTTVTMQGLRVGLDPASIDRLGVTMGESVLVTPTSRRQL